MGITSSGEGHSLPAIDALACWGTSRPAAGRSSGRCRAPRRGRPPAYRVRGGLGELAAAGMVAGESGRFSACPALLPSSWQDTIGPYLPMNAGDTIYTVRPEAHVLGHWAGFGVFFLYAAGALVAGFVLIGGRDA